jgi:hypothetical protein
LSWVPPGTIYNIAERFGWQSVCANKKNRMTLTEACAVDFFHNSVTTNMNCTLTVAKINDFFWKCKVFLLFRHLSGTIKDGSTIIYNVGNHFETFVQAYDKWLE